MRSLTRLLVVLIILLAGILRLAGIYDDFWMDEIWSWRIASQLPHYWQILISPVARWDNNHPLNTFFMCLFGHHPNWPVYRLPALVAGIGTVMVAYVALQRRGLPQAVVGLLLIGFSYPLIHYSSEARGYSLCLFFSVVAFDAMDRYLRRRGLISNLVFIVACLLGLLSHLTFLHFYAGALVWSLCRWRRQGALVANSVRCHLVPLAALMSLHLVFIRHMQIGGAPQERLWRSMTMAIGNLCGADDSPGLALALSLIAIALFTIAVQSLWRKRDDLWIMFVVTVVVAPLVLLALQSFLAEPRQPILPRYFLVPYLFALMAIGLMLSDLLQRGGWLRIGAVLWMGALLLANTWQTILFLRLGRGQYQQAVLEMAQQTRGGVITVLSDHPLRTGMVLEFYAHFLSPHQRMIIYDASGEQPAPFTHGAPMWIVTHSNLRGQPPQQFEGYVFIREFPWFGLSGYSWHLYRREFSP